MVIIGQINSALYEKVTGYVSGNHSPIAIAKRIEVMPKQHKIKREYSAIFSRVEGIGKIAFSMSLYPVMKNTIVIRFAKNRSI